MHKRWQLGGLGLMVLAGGLLSESGCGPTPVNNLQFFKEPNQLLDGRVVGPAQTFAWGVDDLSTALTSQPIDQTGIQFTAANSTSEADIFVRDPKDITSTVKLYAPGDDWFDLYFSEPRSVPPALAIPSGTAMVHPDQSTFFDNQTPFPVITNPSGQVRVQAARVYDHGACSTEIGFATKMKVMKGAKASEPLFPLINHTLFNEVATQISTQSFQGKVCNDDLATMFLLSQRVVAYLDHAQGNQFSVPGGFFVAYDYLLDLHNSFPNDSIWETWQYRLGLSSASDPNGAGILTATVAKEFHDVEGFQASDVQDKLNQGMGTELPEKFHQIALDTQRADFLPSTGILAADRACNPTGTQKPLCANAESALEFAIDSGAVSLGTLTPAEVAALKNAAGQKDANGNLANWTCVPNTGAEAPGNHCEYRVRAKRLNVFPDEAELVWFDGKEVDNPTYALWVAAHATVEGVDTTSAINQLCSAPPHSSTRLRQFAVDSMAPTDSTQVPCPANLPVGTPMLGNCFCFDGVPCKGSDGQAGLCPVDATPNLSECLSSNGCPLPPGTCPGQVVCGDEVPPL